MDRSNRKPWWDSPKGNARDALKECVNEIERRQSSTYERFVRLECLYDPNTWVSDGAGSGGVGLGQITENVIASNVDTVTAVIAATDVRPRFMTTDADWATQRRARHLEWYAEDLGKQCEVAQRSRTSFKSCAKKGIGINHVYADPFGRLQVDSVAPDDIVVDEQECRDGAGPRQMHRRRLRDRDALKAEYPKLADAIDRAPTAGQGDRNRRARSEARTAEQDDVLVTESIRLPVGVKGKPGYKPGRRVIWMDNADLHDKPYEKPMLPIAWVVWSEREGAWYGISLAERIAGHQRTINKRNRQIDATLDRTASPPVYVRPADANLQTKNTNQLGTVAVYKADLPQTPVLAQIHPETYADLDKRKNAAFEESGVNRMGAQGSKPAGLDSGAAIREYRDATTQRFSTPEMGFEQLVLNTYLLLIDCCKDLGAAAPVVAKRSRFGTRRFKWSDVDMGETKAQIAAASTLPRTPAGRSQTALEWAQAGVISMDEFRRLLAHPDLERAMSLYTAALENIEEAFDAIADGGVVMPEPFMNLNMCVVRGQMQYLEWVTATAPEDVLEAIRQFITQAAYMLTMMEAKPANDQMAAAGPMLQPGPAMPQPAIAPPGMLPTAAVG